MMEITNHLHLSPKSGLSTSDISRDKSCFLQKLFFPWDISFFSVIPSFVTVLAVAPTPALQLPPDPCPTLLIYSSFILQQKEGQCLPVVRNFSALSLISGFSCLVSFRYWSTKMFGANWTMFCSPQPKGMLSSWSKFWSAGPMMSPYICEERQEKGKAQTLSSVKQKDCLP